jgi:PAS domain S-box-containing protein
MHKIMVVDDEVIIGMQLEERLVSMGYDVVGMVTSGKAAVEKARSLMPDLILMDIVMPGEMDGIDASKAIRAELDIPIIFLTAYADDNYINRAKSVEPFGYILKPFQEKEIKAAIEVALYNIYARKKLFESVEKYRTILEKANDPILISNAKSGCIFEFNRKAEEFFGIPSEKFVGMEIWQLFPEDRVRNYKKMITDLLKANETKYIELFIMNGKGEVVPVEASVCTAELKGEDVFIAILRDITKRELSDWEKRLIIELLDSLKKKEKKLKGIINICASCKRIKDEDGKWVQLEIYIRENSEVDFSHGICPDCAKELYPDYHKKMN